MQKPRWHDHNPILSEKQAMNDFKWRHFKSDIILGCVRYYCKYGISYRDLEEMMLERGVEVDHTTIHRWVQHHTLRPGNGKAPAVVLEAHYGL